MGLIHITYQVSQEARGNKSRPSHVGSRFVAYIEQHAQVVRFADGSVSNTACIAAHMPMYAE